MSPKTPPKDDPGRPIRYLGVAFLLFGALAPPMLFPHENQILVGFLGAPFVLLGLIMMLAGSFPARRLGDDDPDRKDPKDRS
jgi:hypothetical protein